tara:strand:- start:1647 stop:2564 length:918 start_codon:yes stop_codon:yes gene_type:complete
VNKIIIILFLILSFYIAFIAYSDFSKFSSNIEQFKFEFLPVILGLSFASYFIMGIRQKILLKKLGIEIEFKNNLLLYFSGLSMSVTPGGVGEAIKSLYLKKKYGHSVSKTFPLVLIERFHDLGVVISVIVFTSIFLQISEVIIVEIIIIPLIIIVYVLVRTKKLFIKTIKIFKRIKKFEKVFDNISKSYDGMYEMLDPKTTIKVWIIGIIGQIFFALSIYSVFLAFGQDFGFIFTTEIVYSSILFGAISLLPGGVGLTEITTVNFLTDKGMEISLATSITIMLRLVTIWFSTILGLITTKIFLKE